MGNDPTREPTASDLKRVNEGYKDLVNKSQVPSIFTLSHFEIVIRKAKELAAQVGGIEALAECVKALRELDH
jgi:hypothetical protein